MLHQLERLRCEPQYNKFLLVCAGWQNCRWTGVKQEWLQTCHKSMCLIVAIDGTRQSSCKSQLFQETPTDLRFKGIDCWLYIHTVKWNLKEVQWSLQQEHSVKFSFPSPPRKWKWKYPVTTVCDIDSALTSDAYSHVGLLIFRKKEKYHSEAGFLWLILKLQRNLQPHEIYFAGMTNILQIYTAQILELFKQSLKKDFQPSNKY